MHQARTEPCDARRWLTGSYRRQTKPLRDVDTMIVLTDTSYLDRHPRDVLDVARYALVRTTASSE